MRREATNYHLRPPTYSAAILQRASLVKAGGTGGDIYLMECGDINQLLTTREDEEGFFVIQPIHIPDELKSVLRCFLNGFSDLVTEEDMVKTLMMTGVKGFKQTYMKDLRHHLKVLL